LFWIFVVKKYTAQLLKIYLLYWMLVFTLPLRENKCKTREEEAKHLKLKSSLQVCVVCVLVI
jgi:hypothetical protein